MCPLIDIQEFGKRIKNEFDGQTAGWAYCIKDLSRPQLASVRDHGGSAVLGFDTANYPELPASYDDFKQFIHGVPQRYYKPMEIMSMSKTVTAAAVVKLIQGRTTNPKLHATVKALLSDGFDSPIWPFLPRDWQLGDKMKEVTFRHLLTHAKTFQEYEHDKPVEETGRLTAGYQSMKNAVAFGVKAIGTSLHYQNMNYGLFRILIPYMIQEGGIPKMTKNVPVIPRLERIRFKLGSEGLGTFQDLLGVMFVQEVRAEIFAPADIGDVGVLAPYGAGAPPATRYYLSPEDPTSEGDYSQPFRTVGGTDWKMSCETFLKFLIGLAKGLIAPQSKLWDVMTAEGFGIKKYGSIPGHGGDGFDARLHTGWICAPSLLPGKGVIAVAMINSDMKGKSYDESKGMPGRLAKIYSEL